MSDEIDFEENVEDTEQDDIELSSEDFRGVLLQPSDWTIGSLREQIGDGIDVDPAFQRRSVWPKAKQSLFIESLILQVPVPQVLLAESEQDKNSYIVIDGKQRLLAIQSFFANDLKLTGLKIRSDLNGKKWSDFEEDVKLERGLTNKTLRTVLIVGWQNEKVLYEIFYRLNANSVKLSPMELRIALHPGEFLRLVLGFTSEDGVQGLRADALRDLLRLKGPDMRMRDVELVIRHLAFTYSEQEYDGNLATYLDKVCKEWNVHLCDNDQFESELRQRLTNMEEGIRTGMRIFGEREFCRKYKDDKYETRFNKAIFDVLLSVLSDPDARNKVLQQPEQFKSSFEQASLEPAFYESVTSTTKAVKATKDRYEILENALREDFNLQLRKPNFGG